MTSDDDRPSAAGSSTLDTLLREVARAEPRTPSARDAERLLGEVLDGKYRIDALLGGGGMGTVYVATHVGTGREVAFKVLVPELTANDAAVERFRREARAAGQMRHPNVVDVTDFGFADRGDERLAYLVMELLRGKTLRAVLDAGGALPLEVAVDVLEQVCAAVEEAHGLGILHRDLKPENIHLEPTARGYRVKVLDFGIAKLLHAGDETRGLASPETAAPVPVSGLATTLPAALGTTVPAGSDGAALTRVGAAMGTPQYMSPEQWRGEAVDARTDVYSLGVVAYEMLAGVPPFVGKERWIALEHAEVAPPALAVRAPSVPRRIANVVEAALAKDPAARPRSAAAFAAGLRAGSETTFTLLRRSIALSTEHYVLLSRRCWILTVPPVALTAFGTACAVLVRHGAMRADVGSALGSGTAAAAVLESIVVAMPVGGLLVPLVADLIAASGSPRPPRPPPSGAAVAAAVWRSLPSTFAAVTLMMFAVVIAIPLTLLVRSRWGYGYDEVVSTPLSVLALSAVMSPFAVYGAVAAMERVGGLRPLRRSATLLRPMWRAAFGVQVFYGVLTQALPAIALLVLRDVTGSLPRGTNTTFAVGQLVLNLSSGLLAPFVLVPLALLYLRAREAEGNRVATG